jgi:hypothetical protein
MTERNVEFVPFRDFMRNLRCNDSVDTENLSCDTDEPGNVHSLFDLSRSVNVEAAIRTHIRNERVLEDTLIQLALCVDFTVQNALALFSQNGETGVKLADLHSTYVELGIPHTSDQLELLMRHYDTDGSGILGIDQFREMFLPIDQATRRLAVCRPFLQLGA